MSDKTRTEESHESYGMLQIHRTSSSSETTLFGSSIPHHNIIRLSIHPGVVKRDLNHDWFSSNHQAIIEVELSQSQFAEAITSLNMGSGTPVTIRRLDGKRLTDPPFTSKRMQFENEFQTRMQDLEQSLRHLTENAETIMREKKSISKADRQAILDGIASLRREIASNVPYMVSSYNEQLDKTTTEAKGEIEAFTINKIKQLGLTKLHELNGLPTQIESDKVDITDITPNVQSEDV